MQKQVCFNLGDDLGEAPSLHMDLANFLGGNAANEQNDAAHPLAPSTAGPSQLPCNNGHQHDLTPTGGSQPKSTVKPMAAIWGEPWPRRIPTPVDQVYEWIWVHISQEGRHPHWWRELRALYWGCLVHDLYNTQALHFAQWQATVFGLPLAQAEVSGWWQAPHSLSTLCKWDFLSQVDSPGMRDFHVIRQEETLA